MKEVDTKEVKRYEPIGYDDLSASMEEDAYGEWVALEDYEALLNENKRLREALEEIRRAQYNARVSENNGGCVKRMEMIAEAALQEV